MFGFLWGIYAAVRCGIDGMKEYSHDIDSRIRAEQENRDWYIDSKGYTRDIRNGHKLFIGDERVNGELHTVIKDLKTGAILKDCTLENIERRRAKERDEIIERSKKEKQSCIEYNKKIKEDMEELPESESCKLKFKKYYSCYGESGRRKGNICRRISDDKIVFKRIFNLRQLNDLGIEFGVKDIEPTYPRYPRLLKDVRSNGKYCNIYLFMDENGKIIDYDENFLFGGHRDFNEVSRSWSGYKWMKCFDLKEKDIENIIQQLNQINHSNDPYWDEYIERKRYI